MRACILCSSFNRAATTVAGLTSLSQALARVPGLSFTIFLLDDASPDGTAVQVRQALPDVHIVNGTGSLFWNRGMITAYKAAQMAQDGRWDAYLLFNDDTEVDPDGVRQFFAHYIRENEIGSTACIGRLVDPKTGATTYGGFRRPSRCHPLRVHRVEPAGATTTCDTFNGNFVLIPAAAFLAIDGLCPAYWHSYGDIDAGYALTRQGTRLMMVAAPIGTARLNPPSDMSTWRKRRHKLFGPPNTVGQTFTFYRRNGCACCWRLYAVGAIMKKWFFVLRGGSGLNKRSSN